MTRIPISLEGASFGEARAEEVELHVRAGAGARFVKRAMDIAAALFGLVLLTPLFGLISLWIAVDSPGGVFYRQPRIGKGGRVFDLIKFRTMARNAEQALDEELLSNPKLRTEWDDYQKLRHDPRTTAAGRWLRRFDLDELPQLWNVLKGEMSLVGPRPILVNQRELYGNAYAAYVRVLPGMTGLWQVSGRNRTTFARRVELDRQYIESWSMGLDAYVLVKTIGVVGRQ
jgi:lipopolysaccharide/colanic/teichoic acid biosynthesis glycosyltransferase